MLIKINGIELDIEDDPNKGIIPLVSEEIATYYELDIPYKDADTVVDIGAQVGMVSCYLAKKYPFLRIYSYEPVTQNFTRAYRNIRVNGIFNCQLYPMAVTADGRDIHIGYSEINSGSHSMYLNTDGEVSKSIAIAKALKKFNKVRLLKMDCEGAEYEIIEELHRLELLRKIQSIRGEIHGLPGKSSEKLLKMLRNDIPDVKMVVGGPIGA
jgi:FkbM family methyltransferase